MFVFIPPIHSMSDVFMKPNCVLFIPVSSPSGIGEYMRSMIIAQALQLRWPNINIHFILNEQVAYFNDCPYIVHACQGSPTKDVTRVNTIITNIKPDLVLFDASGRAKQFKQAQAVGAKVAFISQHDKKRSRGLKLNRLFNTDIHWVAQPDFCIKPISYWQRAKLNLFNKPAPKNIGPVFEVSSVDYQNQLLARYGFVKEQYFIFNAGSGGHLVAGELAADIYYQAALAFSRQSEIKCLVIFGDNYPKELPEDDDIICLKSINNKDFISLIVNAQACVISAGDTLLQCIALHKACVAAPISPDQPARLKLCQHKQLVLVAEATPASLVQQAQRLIEKKQRQTLLGNMAQLAPVKALDIIVDDIAALFTH
ncbi:MULTISPECIES: glycosyltransferase family 1 protein [Colwellia]|uniref:Glycosyl transferase n=1 Tax=Colwellia marinimaniae TaxID=1513592 RepID=A0ABQ0MWY9_9GAMM|nr:MULTISPECIES: glycosyltransferase family 1 protein [Colwellia]GAW96891.1 hypothetical protein MTCD1_02514 [Colwellia marinimaniae]